MLAVDRLNVAYGSVQVLWDVSFNVSPGEIVALLGANGAGKTTTLNTVSGIVRPLSGAMSFEGHSLERLPPHRIVERGVSQVPEGRLMFSSMTVQEGLLIGAFAPSARPRLAENLDLVYQIFPVLKERRRQLAGTLSGGQQQMLAIARALMSSPKLLLLDEPSLGLAPMLIREIFEVLRGLAERRIVTMLLVEQNTQYALEFATRGYVLESGRITLEGKAVDLLNNDHVRRAYLGL